MSPAHVALVEQEPAPAGVAPPAAESLAPADDAGILRELVLQAHRDVVPEMVQGTTLQELLASLPAAQDAWRNALERLRQGEPGAAPPVPAGASVRSATSDPDALSPLAKIRAGMR